MIKMPHHTPGDCFEVSAVALEERAREAYASGAAAKGDELRRVALELMKMAQEVRSRD